MLGAPAFQPERRVRNQIGLWWWFGLVLALLVRIGWIATLQVPESFHQGVEVLVAGKIHPQGQPGADALAGENATGQTPSTEPGPATSLIDLDSLSWQYVVQPGLSYVRQWLPHRPIPWHWWVGSWQAVLHSLACAGVAATAWQAFGSAAFALVALLAMAFYPDGLLFLLTVSDVPLVQALISNWLAVVMSSARRGGILGPLCVGLLAGGMVLIRAGVLLAVAVIFIWYLWQMRVVHHGWLASLIAVLALLMLMTTWFVRHWQKTNEPVPLAAIFWRYHYHGVPAELQQQQQSAEVSWQEAAKMVTQCWSENPGQCLTHRLTVWSELFRDKRSEPAYIPSWLPSRAVLTCRPAWHLLFCLAVLLGWRWSFAWAKEHRPLTVMALALPIAYSFGPMDGVQEGWAFSLPIFMIYAALGLLGAVPGLGARLFPTRESVPTQPHPAGEVNPSVGSH